MEAKILTDVSATVEPSRESELRDGFRTLTRHEVPDGLERTELLRGPDGRWHIQTLWRDRAALDAMRASGEPPAAPALFRTVGAEPALTVLEVAADHVVRPLDLRRGPEPPPPLRRVTP